MVRYAGHQVRSVNTFSQEQQELTKRLQASLADAMKVQGASDTAGGKAYEEMVGRLAEAEREMKRLMAELESARGYEVGAFECP